MPGRETIAADCLVVPGGARDHVVGLEAPADARVLHQPPAVDHRGLERGGDGRVPAGDPTVSVSREPSCNFAASYKSKIRSLHRPAK